MWPWGKSRQREAAKARAQVEAVDRQLRESERRRCDADQVIAKGQRSSAALRHQIELNGWTQLLQQSMEGGR